MLSPHQPREGNVTWHGACDAQIYANASAATVRSTSSDALSTASSYSPLSSPSAPNRSSVTFASASSSSAAAAAATAAPDELHIAIAMELESSWCDGLPWTAVVGCLLQSPENWEQSSAPPAARAANLHIFSHIWSKQPLVNIVLGPHVQIKTSSKIRPAYLAVAIDGGRDRLILSFRSSGSYHIFTKACVAAGCAHVCDDD
jgi:hypothetical protein